MTVFSTREANKKVEEEEVECEQNRRGIHRVKAGSDAEGRSAETTVMPEKPEVTFWTNNSNNIIA